MCFYCIVKSFANLKLYNLQGPSLQKNLLINSNEFNFHRLANFTYQYTYNYLIRISLVETRAMGILACTHSPFNFMDQLYGLFAYQRPHNDSSHLRIERLYF